jgi:hypothetical protein
MNTDKWKFWCNDLTKTEREYLSGLANTGEELDSYIDQLRARPRSAINTNHTNALYELAGLAADEYSGGGWMRIRGMLVEFHLKMKKLGL